MKLVAVDIGIRNFAMAMGDVDDDNGDVTISRARRVDITVFACNRLTCDLQHKHMAADWVAHVVRRFSDEFGAADEVIIERQPPGGLRDVEQVLFQTFRHKARVLQPQTMHRHVGLGPSATYDTRKDKTVEVASKYYPVLTTRFADKPDDVADAICLLVTRGTALARQLSAQKQLREAKARGLDFESFMHVPK